LITNIIIKRGVCVYEKKIIAYLLSFLTIITALSGCGKSTSDGSDVSDAVPIEKLTLLNTKSEVAAQMETLASKYT